MHLPTFGVRARFVALAVVLIPALGMLAWTGSQGLASSRRVNNLLFNDIIATQHASAAMVSAMDKVHATAIEAIATRTDDPSRSRQLTARLANELIPAADAGLAEVERLHADDGAEEKQTIAELAVRWVSVRSDLNSLALAPTAPARDIATIDNGFVRLDQSSGALVTRETTDGRTEYIDSRQPDNAWHRGIVLCLLIGLSATIASILWLYSGVLPRTRRYSAFATNVADGDFTGRIDARGRDELAVLGNALDDMSTRRQDERNYNVSQLEFADNLQLSDDEAEAHRILKRHLERTIECDQVVILNRNNSEDRLTAVTEIGPDSPLGASLAGAAPRSCIAVRQARTHHGEGGVDALLECSVCVVCPDRSTCTPFLVGGEVIGSVLISHADVLHSDETRRIRESVVQAAPVLANLRNLAIAQTRAATDSLTGLPNRRSVDANIMRMVAHAGRSKESVAVLLLDLDHFKLVNDRFGHIGGDEVLAAVGAVIRAGVRDSDFAGRYGGEEFVVALPNASVDGAVNVAELLRQGIAKIVVPSVEQSITVSIGVALLPTHAGDGAGLVRAADRALYLAKNLGRNRVETARSNDPDLSSAPAAVADARAGTFRP